ncbi:hypothetical protein C8N24_2871 [Solirubrobacter pauli]|uniref:Uncharacterized protein n=1 Tax=Solirubrobacter pauli TaxID=166793 RepID=A0A660LDC3_9ACTN|nr:hypothetical protein [Solirubrobacter pauli]RKQ93012.1 hypothetical protein C8N24_2871 [Solirubrobacter pauli]
MSSFRRVATAATALAFAGALTAPAAHAATTPGGDLYLATAGAGALTPTGHDTYRLTLRDPAAELTAFTDRPARTSSSVPLRRFVSGWDEAGFAADPPNAALTIDGAPARHDTMIVELTHPQLTRSGALTLRARRVPGPASGSLAAFSRRADPRLPLTFGKAELFIDSGAAAVQPVRISVDVPAYKNVDVNFDPSDMTLTGGPLVWTTNAAGGLTVSANGIGVSAPAAMQGVLTGYTPAGADSISGTATIPDGATVTATVGNGRPIPITNGAFSIPLD